MDILQKIKIKVMEKIDFSYETNEETNETRISFDLPTDIARKGTQALCSRGIKYSPTIKDENGNDIPNPEEPADFALSKVVDYFLAELVAFINDEAEAAKLIELNRIENEI